MDPATVAMGIELIAEVATTMQQYQSGTITQDQAHQQLVTACSKLNSAVDQFLSAQKPS